VVEGARRRTDHFTVPLYRRPPDLVSLDPPDPGGAFANGGQVVRRVDGKDTPYFTRGEIEDGALAGKGLELVWLADPVDAFFIAIQGSARIALAEGGELCLNYDAHNGHKYYPVGRALIDRGLVPKEEMSLARIRDFMRADPQEGKALRRLNPSYVFFRAVAAPPDSGPMGAQNVTLTAGRSIAVDKRLHVYGVPVFIDADLPLDDSRDTRPFRRLMIAQDTGSAIVGPARADIYLGHGPAIAEQAGRLRHRGQFVVLLPRGITP
jgi:membrane-bound lytic murein transglycosylase A